MTISIRIIHLDHYMAKPGPLDRAFSPFSDKELSKVPVLRIFGSTKAGQKVCLHIHQIFPYFFVPYSIPAEYTTEKEIQKDIFQFGTSLNEAMNLTRPNAEKDQHIAAIVLTKGIPFYGYHIGYQTYLKIYMANPYEKQQILEILQTNAIGNTSYQPYEAHLNFELQFLMDHNLYGMDWIHIDENHGLNSTSASFGIRFRLPLLNKPKTTYHISQPSSHSAISSFTTSKGLDATIYTSETVPVQLQSDAVPRQSYCELEMDITGMSILNRHDIKERNIHTSLKKEKEIEANMLSSEQEVDKLVKSLDSIWKDEASRRRSRGITEPIPPVTQVDERDPRMPWSSEPLLRCRMEKMMSHKSFNENSETQDSSVLISGIMTVFQAVEALYPEDYFVYSQEKQQQQQQQQQLSVNPTFQVGEETELLASSTGTPFSPLLPSSNTDATPGRRVTSPLPTTPISNQFNISATPSRYRVWNLCSQLDKSVIHTVMEDSSFGQDDEEEYLHDKVGGEDDVYTKNDYSEDDEDDDDDAFSLENSLRNSDLVRWLEKSEKEAAATAAAPQRYPTQIIEYESPETTSYQPRKLDFIAESEKMEAILQTQSKNFKKDILDFSEEKDDSNQEPFHISPLPPDSMPHVLRSLQRAKRIDQVDGPSDQPEKKPNKRPKSAEARWEQEKKILKRMRMKKSAAKQLQKDIHTSSAPLKTQVDTVEPVVDLCKMKSSASVDVEKMIGGQRVIVKIPRYIPKKRKADTSASKNQALLLSKPEPCNTQSIRTIEPTALDKFCSPLPTIEGADSKIMPLILSRKATNDSDLDRYLYRHIDVSPQEARPMPSSLKSSVQCISVSASSNNNVPTFMLNTQIISSMDTEDLLRPTVLNSVDSLNEDSKEAKVPAKIDSQVPRLSGHKNSENKISTSKSEEHADGYSNFMYDPADFKNTQSCISDHHPVICSDTQVTKSLTYNHAPPVISKEDLSKESVIYQEPFYSKPSDLPRYPPVFAGKEFKLPVRDLKSLKQFKSSFDVQTNYNDLKSKTRIKVWTPSQTPPTLADVKEWLHNEGSNKKTAISLQERRTQLSEPTAPNPFKFKSSAGKPKNKVKRVRDYIQYFSLEVHVNTRDQLLPDPEHDAVQLIFWCLQTEDDCIPSNGYQKDYYVGVIAVQEFDISKVGLSNAHIRIDYAQNEEQLFSMLIEKVRYYDPDMLVGYEIQNASWGYLVDRGIQLGFHMLDELSRIIVTSETIKRDQWGYQKASVYRVFGRHMLNIWRLMRSELALTSYTFENVAYNLLHDRVPHYSYATLTSWYQKGPFVLKYRLFKYYMKRVQLNLDILDVSEVVSRKCESARVYGIDFYAVISRGSQYNVESVMFRIAKPENYVLLTPSRQQVAAQRSLEMLPLVMEPISQFYSSPMVVLDFQSLYPSIMIAYNYCYSTCLGRVRKPGESSRLGVLSSFELDDGLLDTLKDCINVSPNGIMFVKPEIRKSLLAKMLSEILDTRVMIKKTMKDYNEDSGLLRMLDAKQLTLKLLANVTYGYTSASFSGRMPSVEIADSIVSTARETLERAIRLINNTEKWGARVVYGDTDSVFIYFPGKTKEEAFTLGNEIAETVTKMNPNPVKLKFEKVYHPAVLLAKKRYVGFKYENPNDTKPIFEAKGIETVRRDGTVATQKILESCLKILFRTQDMSELKEFLYRQWTKILSNRVLLQDFIIAKEVRMGTYSVRGGPNGAHIAQARMNIDARAEPQYGERVPYVVIYRGPNARLKDKVVRPEVLLQDSSLRLDAEYYIRKQIIPPLSRVFNLMGVDILSWYESMPRSQKVAAMNLAQNAEHQAKNLMRIDQYYASSHCIICRKLTDQSLCEQCQQNPSQAIFNLASRQQLTQQRFRKMLQICQDCSTISPLDAISVSSDADAMADIPCDSLDCPGFYERLKAKKDVQAACSYSSLIEDFFSSS